MRNIWEFIFGFQWSAMDKACASALVILISLAFGPAILGTYGFGDDYAALTYPGSSLPSQWRWGRPLTGVFMDVGFGLFGTVGELRWLRLTFLITLCGFALTVFAFLRSFGYSTLFALIGSFGMVMLTPFQTFASWAVCFPYAIGAWISFLAGWYVSRCVANQIQAETSVIRIGGILGAAFAVGLSSMIYQPVAMFFWVSAVWLLLHERCEVEVLIKRFLLIIITGLGGVFFGYIAFKFGNMLAGEFGGDRSGLTTDVFGKLGWFLTKALPQVTQLQWPGLKLHWPIALALMAFVIAGYCRNKQLGMINNALRIAVAISALFLCYIPNLVVAESWASARTLVAVYALFWLFVVGFVWRLYGANAGLQRKLGMVKGPLAVVVILMLVVRP